MSGKLYNVGKIVNTHGILGEVKVLPHTDFAAERFAKGSKLILTDPSQSTQIPIVVEAGRPQKNVYLVRFSGLNDINQVERYKGWSLKIREEDQVELEEGEYYHHQIIGCAVVTEDGEALGTVSEILTPGANDVWVVSRQSGKPVLLPVIDDVVLEVDVTAKRITVRLMEGLLD